MLVVLILGAFFSSSLYRNQENISREKECLRQKPGITMYHTNTPYDTSLAETHTQQNVQLHR
jgi:hypothetical protein